jgi:hypothetical protein
MGGASERAGLSTRATSAPRNRGAAARATHSRVYTSSSVKIRPARPRDARELPQARPQWLLGWLATAVPEQRTIDARGPTCPALRQLIGFLPPAD